MLKITDMIVSGLLKKGILSEIRNLDVEFEVPKLDEDGVRALKDEKIKIHVKAEHVTVRFEKE